MDLLKVGYVILIGIVILSLGLWGYSSYKNRGWERLVNCPIGGRVFYDAQSKINGENCDLDKCVRVDNTLGENAEVDRCLCGENKVVYMMCIMENRDLWLYQNWDSVNFTHNKNALKKLNFNGA